MTASTTTSPLTKCNILHLSCLSGHIPLCLYVRNSERMRSNKRVYLVDDDEDDVLFISQALKMVIADVDIMAFKDGQELLNFIAYQEKEQKPALILMDMNMPRVNGLEALIALKSDPNTSYIPVVMVSTSSNQSFVRQAYQQGVNAFLIKPVSMDGYLLVAHAVATCYLNVYPAPDHADIQHRFENKSILVIEDDSDHWVVMKDTLKRVIDIKIDRTSDCQSTLQYLQHQWDSFKSAPGLIILDLYLPERHDGLGLLDSIRDYCSTHGLPVIAVIIFSFSQSQEDINLSYDHHANAYMIKHQHVGGSFSQLNNICHFWWNTITLPQRAQ